MAPVLNRLMMSPIGSTSSIEIGSRDSVSNRNRPRSVASVRGLVVDEARVLLEDVVALGPARVLQLEDRLGVEEVVLTLAAPLVLAADIERAVGAFGRVGGMGVAVACAHLVGQLVEADTTEAADRAREELVDQVLGQADRFEDLGAGVRSDRADAHLRHHLEHALAARLDVVRDGLLRVVDVGRAFGDQILDGLEGEIRIDGGRAVSEQQAHVMHLARLTGLDHETDLGAGLLADEVVVHRAR